MVLPRASPLLAEVAGSQHASGRSPDLVSQTRNRSRVVAACSLPDLDQWPIASGFESITVAGPRGNLTRFPILPDQSRGTRSSKLDFEKNQDEEELS